MDKYKVVDAEQLDADLTEIADEVRILTDTIDTMTVDEITSNIAQVNTDVEAQADIIAQIQTALEGKAAGNGSEIIAKIASLIDQSGVLDNTDETVTVTEKVEQLIDKAEFVDKFWNAYQKNGTRTDYNNAFGYDYFTDETFYPKYDIITSKGTVGLFRQSENLKIDLIERLKSCNVTLDTSAQTYAQYMFEGCNGITAIPTLSFINAKGAIYTFNGCNNLVTIEKLIVNKNLPLDNCFAGCTALQNILFEGEIGKDVKIHQSSKLTPESVQSIFNCLSSTATGQTLTLPSAFENPDTEAVVTANIVEVDGVKRIKDKEGWTLVR